MAKKEETVIVNFSIDWDVITSIPYLMEDGLNAIMNLGPVNGRPYINTRMATIIQIVVDKTSSENFESIHLEICPRQALDDIIWSPYYLIKVTEAFFDTDELREQVPSVVKPEVRALLGVSSKKEERIETFARDAKSTISICSAPSSESQPKHVPYDAIKKRA